MSFLPGAAAYGRLLRLPTARRSVVASSVCRLSYGTLVLALVLVAPIAGSHRRRLSLNRAAAHKGIKIRAWCAKHNVELCFTPTCSSWANPIECHFGPLRDFVLNNSDHPNHGVLTGRLHAYLRWRNTHGSDPAMRERLRRERARLRSERHRRWGRPRVDAVPEAA